MELRLNNRRKPTPNKRPRPTQGLDPQRTAGIRRAFNAEVRRMLGSAVSATARGMLGEMPSFTTNVFCPTGPGGGVDPTCEKHDKQESLKELVERLRTEVGVKAEVKTVVKKTEGNYGAAAVEEWNPDTKEWKIGSTIEINDNGNLKPGQLELIVRHEMVHIKQSEDGRLVRKKNDDGDFAYYWDGQEVITYKELTRLTGRASGKGTLKSRMSSIQKYKELPWEKEAYHAADPNTLNSSSQDVERFERWFTDLMDRAVLQPSRSVIARYVDLSFRTGSGRVFDDFHAGKPRGVGEPAGMREGMRRQFVEDLAGHPQTTVTVITHNSFCPTGKGGGVDPTCSPNGYAKHLDALRSVSAWDGGPSVLSMAAEGRNTVLAGESIKKVHEKIGNSPEDVQKLKDLLRRHSLGGSNEQEQKTMDQPLLDAYHSQSSLGKTVRDHAKLETTLLRETDRQLRSTGEIGVVLYRKGTTGHGGVESWTMSSEGADISPLSGGNKLKPNLKMTVSEMLSKGYVAIGGVGWMTGSPGESEVTLIHDPKRKPVVNAFGVFGRAADKVRTITARVYNDLKSVVQGIVSRGTRVIADAIEKNKEPSQVTRQILEEVKKGLDGALTTAGDAISRGFVAGQIAALRQLGVKSVTAAVEWTVRRENDGTIAKTVCKLCRPLDGLIFTVDEAEGLFPRHPKCQCSLQIPTKYGVGRKIRVSTKAEIEDAMVKSRGTAKSQQGWGKGVKIQKTRPTRNQAVEILPGVALFSSLRESAGLVGNVFCPTGPGGGVDPTCGAKNKISFKEWLEILGFQQRDEPLREDAPGIQSPNFKGIGHPSDSIRSLGKSTGVSFDEAAAVIKPTVFRPFNDSYAGTALPASVERVLGVSRSPFDLSREQTAIESLSDVTKKSINADFRANGFSFNKRMGNTIEDKLVLAAYEKTQSTLRNAGITELELHRGSKGVRTNNHNNALESWTIDKKVAEEFARAYKGSVETLKIPASRIFSMPSTGFGVASQAEVLVLGSEPKTKSVSNEWSAPPEVVNAYSSLRTAAGLGLNVFCATGEGGGVDPSCGKGEVVDVYHGSVEAYAADIRKSGIRLRPDVKRSFAPSEGGGYYKDDRGSSVYVTDSVSMADQYASRRSRMEKSAPIIVHAEVPVEEFKKFKEDDREASSWHVDRVRPEWIKSINRVTEKDGQIVLAPIQNAATRSLYLVVELRDLVSNVFCPTGPGGGVDPTCSPGGSEHQSLPKGQWKKLEVGSEEFEKYRKNLFDLVTKAYSDIGGHIKIQSEKDLSQYRYWLVQDMDSDPQIDVAIFGKGEFGVKSGGVGHDGSKESVEAYKNMASSLKKGEIPDSANWWGEASGKAAYALMNRGVPGVEDEATVRKLLGKDKFVWHGEHPDPQAPELFKKYKGWYEKDFGAGGKHVKMILGLPKVDDTRNVLLPEGLHPGIALFASLRILAGLTENVFCPTGPGGGVDPTCSPKHSIGLKLPPEPSFISKDQANVEANKKAIKEMQELADSGSAEQLENHPGTMSPKVQQYKKDLIEAYKKHVQETPKGNSSFPDPSKVEVVKDLPGSTHPKLVKDPSGTLWVQKTGEPEFLRNEVDTDNVYRALGIAVPDSGIVVKDGKTYKYSRFLEGETLSKWEQGKSVAEIYEVHKQLREGFAADALLGNRDVVGLTKDNILVGKDGKAYRIDNGGGLLFRAQGEKKTDFGGEVGELSTLRNSAFNASAASVFGTLPDEAVKAQVVHLLANDAKIVDAISNPITRTKVKARLGYLDKWGGPGSNPPKATLHTPHGLATYIKNNQGKAKFTDLELKKIEFLNPKGIEDGVIRIGILSKNKAAKAIEDAKETGRHTQEAQVATLKNILPAGTKIKIQKISKKELTKTYGSEGTFTTVSAGEGDKKKAEISGLKEHDPPDGSGTFHLASGKAYSSKAAEKLVASLTMDQKGAIASWKGSASSIRKAVHTGPMTDKAKNFMDAIMKAEPHEGLVYRGISGSYAEGIAKQIEDAGVGGTWSDTAPHCTSRYPKIGLKFASGQVLFRIHSKTCRPIQKVDGYENEAEAVGLPNVVYRIVGIHKDAKHSEPYYGGKVKHMIDLVEE